MLDDEYPVESALMEEAEGQAVEKVRTTVEPCALTSK